MQDDVLSTGEINQLLDAISVSGGDSKGSISSDDGDLYDLSAVQKKIKLYDFKRPDKFSKDQIRTIQIIHETFARLASTLLSTKLRSIVDLHVASVDQLTYEEFLRSIPNPTTLCIINVDPLKGSAIFETDPSITFSLIDRIFGGMGENTKLNRELTEIEISVVEGVMIQLLGSFREAWSGVIDIAPRLGNIETNPQFAQIIPANEMVILISLDMKIHNTEGTINICIPYITIQPIIQKLSAQYWFSPTLPNFSNINEVILKGQLDDVNVELSVEVGNTDLSFNDIWELEKGDLIMLPKTSVNDEFTLLVEQRPKFKCRPGRRKNTIVVQLGDEINDTPDELLHSTRHDM